MRKSVGIIYRSRYPLSSNTKLSLYYHAHSAPLFAKFKILDIFNITTFHIAKFMFSYHHLLLPSSFLVLFITGGEVHSYPTKLWRCVAWIEWMKLAKE